MADKRHDEELSIPPGAFEDPKSAELLRAWVANGGLHCNLRIGAFGDNEAITWGILLSDVARHVADALAKEKGIDRRETLTAIREHFDMEFDEPTAETKGGFIQ
jgi:hypothetical protein